MGLFMEQEENLKILAENLRKAIVNLKIDHESSEYKYVTISLGYSYSLPTIGIEKSVLIEVADKNLYRAKLIGKNQVSGS